jgi:hypothetical protein
MWAQWCRADGGLTALTTHLEAVDVIGCLFTAIDHYKALIPANRKTASCSELAPVECGLSRRQRQLRACGLAENLLIIELVDFATALRVSDLGLNHTY